MFKNKIEDYIIGREIGKGAYASVKSCVHKPTGAKLAIKIYDKVKLDDMHKKNAVKREIQVLKILNHSNIVKLYEVIDTIKNIYLIMELVNGISLLSYLKSKSDRRAGKENTVKLFKQLVEALNYCHEKNVCHRDIKLENIIVDNDLNLKLIDFGFSAIISNNKLQNFFCGTPSYMPPEIVQKKEYLAYNADVWCLGILLYTLLCGCFPFVGDNEKDLYGKIMKGIYTIPNYIDTDEKHLLEKLLSISPLSRPSTDKVSIY